MKRIVTTLGILVFFSGHAFAQCAPGIPGAGNPGCIPPNQTNSPYYNGNGAAPSAPQPRWEDRWGAIAMDPDTARAGTVTGETSKERAIQEALDRCSSNGGNHCKVTFSYYNQCAAVAQDSSGGNIYSAGAASQEKAESNALSDCGKKQKSCEIVYRACSFAEQAQN